MQTQFSGDCLYSFATVEMFLDSIRQIQIFYAFLDNFRADIKQLFCKSGYFKMRISGSDLDCFQSDPAKF